MSELRAKVTERIRDYTKDIRLVSLSLAETETTIKEYLQQTRWRLIQQCYEDSSFTIRAHSPTTSLFRLLAMREPQIAVWQISEQTDRVEIKMFFELTTSLRFLRYFLFWAPIVWFLAVLPIHPPQAIGPFIYFWFLFLPVGLAFVILVLPMFDTKYRYFVEEFFLCVYNRANREAEVLKAAHAHPPDILTVPLFILIVLVLNMSQIIQDYADLSSSKLLFFGLVTTSALVGILFLLLFAKPDLLDTGARGDFSIYPLISSPLLIYSISTMGLKSTWDATKLDPVFLLSLFVPVTILVSCVTMSWSADQLAFKVWSLINEADSTPQRTPRSRRSQASVIALGLIFICWVAFALINLVGVYFAAVALEYCIFGTNHFLVTEFTSALAALPKQGYVRISLGVYTLPIVLIFSLFLLKRLNILLNIKKVRRSRPVPEELMQKVRTLCTYADVKPPLVVIEEHSLITAGVSQVIVLGSVLRISTAALAVLSEDELEALMAHEIGHLKKHSLIFSLLTTLSKLTLLGGSFLAVLLNTMELEHQADAFSIKYLAQKMPPLPKGVLISTLEKIVITNSLSRQLTPSKIRLLYEIYFGDLTVLYIHPAIDERINRIEALA